MVAEMGAEGQGAMMTSSHRFGRSRASCMKGGFDQCDDHPSLVFSLIEWAAYDTTWRVF